MNFRERDYFLTSVFRNLKVDFESDLKVDFGSEAARGAFLEAIRESSRAAQEVRRSAGDLPPEPV